MKLKPLIINLSIILASVIIIILFFKSRFGDYGSYRFVKDSYLNEKQIRILTKFMKNVLLITNVLKDTHQLR